MQEIDPKIDPAKMDQFDIFEDQTENQSTKNLLSEIFSSVPGIDEAMSFSKLMRYTYL
jgi:arsenite-transporting ATPase